MTSGIGPKLIARVEFGAPSGCWLWAAGVDACGYGKLWSDGDKRLAHRLSFAVFRGPIPPGLYVCHRCDTPACINPDHLFLGTQKANLADMTTKGRRVTAPRDGERNGRARLNATQAAEIKVALDAGIGTTAIAKRYSVGRSTIGSIKAGKTWQ